MYLTKKSKVTSYCLQLMTNSWCCEFDNEVADLKIRRFQHVFEAVAFHRLILLLDGLISQIIGNYGATFYQSLTLRIERKEMCSLEVRFECLPIVIDFV